MSIPPGTPCIQHKYLLPKHTYITHTHTYRNISQHTSALNVSFWDVKSCSLVKCADVSDRPLEQGYTSDTQHRVNSLKTASFIAKTVSTSNLYYPKSLHLLFPRIQPNSSPPFFINHSLPYFSFNSDFLIPFSARSCTISDRSFKSHLCGLSGDADQSSS